MSENPPTKRTLLQKYEIPAEFLDFEYINLCNDPKMIERIVKILHSGEEGFYPDLTKCAEQKLKLLKPDSKMFRNELPALKVESLDEDERNKIEDEMKSWIDEMKHQDAVLKEIKPMECQSMPPIRCSIASKEKSHSTKKSYEKINSTDYEKWDKFDADAAELKIDLDEERRRENVEEKNKKNLQESKLIEVIEDDATDRLSNFDKDRLSKMYKERGNEAFKAKDYEEAIKEYTQSLRIKQNAASFNNRALICKFNFFLI